MLWEGGAQAAVTNADWPAAIGMRSAPAIITYGRVSPGRRPSPGHRRAGPAHMGPSRRGTQELVAALEVLRTDPDTDTLMPWSNWRRWRRSRARPTPTGSAPRCSSLARPLALAASQLGGLFVVPGDLPQRRGQKAPASSGLSHPSLPGWAEQVGDNLSLGLCVCPQPGRHAGSHRSGGCGGRCPRPAAGHLRQVGARVISGLCHRET